MSRSITRTLLTARSAPTLTSTARLYLNYRPFTTTLKMSDEYSKTAKEEPGLTQKLTDARTFMGNHKVVLLTTRSPAGALHARTMAIAEITKDWKFRFIYDNESYKEKEVDNE